MTRDLPTIACDLMIVGTGMAGMAAAVFASRRGIETVQAGTTGESIFATGLLDLLGVHPVEAGRRWENPWAAVAALSADCPRHPYARLAEADMRAAFDGILAFLEAADLPYRREENRNLCVPTPAGTLKTTYAVPRTVYNVVPALMAGTACLLVDFQGLRGFSAVQIAETLKPRWPSLSACRLAFPGALPGDLHPERMALGLERPENRVRLAERIAPHLGRAQAVGLPAVLGIYRSRAVFEDLQRLLGRPLFEIPTLPPSATGLRLRAAFQQHLPARGVRVFHQHTVFRVSGNGRPELRFEIGRQQPEILVRARGAILASGRFLGRGLHAERGKICETLFGFPVHQPAHRSLWHRQDLLDPAGHPIHRAGIETDASLRPLGADGRAAFPAVFAAGSVLAHQDWIRQKCGSGLAIGTAYAAVKNFAGSRT